MTPSRQRTLIMGLIVIGIVFVGFFGLRAFHAFRKFHGQRPPHFPPADAAPAETDVELIRDWMTLPYISMTYHLPRNLLYETLDISPRDNEEKSLKQLNEEYFPNQPEYVLESVKAAVLANQPPPTVAPPTTISPPVAP